MIQNPARKTKINLEDYPYRQDIEYRLLMSDLTLFEVDVIQEILYSSLKIPLNRLLEELDVNIDKMEPVLKKLTEMKLLQVHGDTIEVNKEMRKYYESQMPKFDDNFRADMRYLKGLLSKVPIHVLPLWYLIPRSSDDIFSSIIEKFLITPKLYKRHLLDLQFDDPILNKIVDDVYSSPDFKVYAKDLIEKYSIDLAKFKEYMLQLEFNLACCLSYNEVDGNWVEVITPFYEWRQFLRFQRDTMPKPIEDTSSIERTLEDDFGYVQDLTRLLLATQDKELILTNGIPSQEDIIKFFPDYEGNIPPSDYFSGLIQRAIKMKFAEMDGDRLIALESANDWIKKPLREQAMMIYRSQGKHGIDKDTRAIVKSVKRVLNSGWIYFEDFLQGFAAPIIDHAPVTLQKTGKRWEYILPKYSDSEKLLLRNTLFQLLFESGMAATGVHQGKPCFKITEYGKITLD